MTSFLEQRKHLRVKPLIPLKYKKLRASAAKEGSVSMSKNLSQGGILFNTTEFVSMACRLVLELDLPMLSDPVKIISKVAWIRKTSPDNYEIGNQFIDMSKKDAQIVSEYIDSLAGYTAPCGAETHDDTSVSSAETEISQVAD
ncbi:MAG: PilZ domain-containing protein [Candidatus Omnitrophota bacterium]